MLRFSLFLAVIVTVANSAKAVVVDDTAYLLFARHLAVQPLKPYDFELFFYAEPQPAMEILMPPVLPYWLAAGIALFGEKTFLLKLWLFPFAGILAVSLAVLLRRFTGEDRKLSLAVLMLSSAVLPLFNFMLDVPAIALGLAAVTLFVNATEAPTKGKWWTCVIGSGLFTGLAIETKYSQLVIPAVIAFYGLIHRKFATAAIALAIALLLIVGWERFVMVQCGQSHFLLHFQSATGNADAGPIDKLRAKFEYALPLTTQLGGVAFGFALWGLRAAGAPKWLDYACAAVSVIAISLVLIYPDSQLVFTDRTLFRYQLDVPFTASLLSGVGALTVSLAILLRFSRTPGTTHRDSLFLAAWFALEILGVLGMSPFPAARRFIGLALVIGLIVARGIVRFEPPGRWIAGVAISWGFTLFALDCWDAEAERVTVIQARDIIRPTATQTIWYTGHWGFQYYADRAAFRQLNPKQWRPAVGDWFVFPELPDEYEYYRPCPPLRVLPDWLKVELVGEVVCDDRLRAQTVPNLYCGAAVLHGREYPRLKLAVYRITGP
ncbi:hypothetical protein BH11PLA2_BH11PLA2_14920 [soil metagenome]